MSTDNIDNLKQLLTDGGYRFTKARETTFKLLINSEPQSISEILAKAKGKVDRVSVYRNIELFERLGIVHRIHIGLKHKLELSDNFMEHHHHLSCLGCGKIIEIVNVRHIEDFIDQVAAKAKFKPRRHQFEVDGYCEKCSHVPSAGQTS